MKNKIIYIILFLSILPSFTINLFSQEPTLISPYVTLQYFKDSDNQRILQTTLTYSMNRMEVPLPGMEISFFTGVDQKDLIARAITDEKGIARMVLDDTVNIKVDSDGMWAFSSEFSGNDTIEYGSSDITIQDVNLEMTLNEIDSIKTVNVAAFVIDAGKQRAVQDESVMIYVPRMFSMLLISELTLDENGKASFEFPSDLPGDKEGNLTVIAKFEENYSFGNVEKRETLMWGTPTDYSVPVSHRALWTKTAPKWMIYTLSVLLAGVWGHYMFAIISLIRIKREANRVKAKEEYKV